VDLGEGEGRGVPSAVGTRILDGAIVEDVLVLVEIVLIAATLVEVTGSTDDVSILDVVELVVLPPVAVADPTLQPLFLLPWEVRKGKYT